MIFSVQVHFEGIRGRIVAGVTATALITLPVAAPLADGADTAIQPVADEAAPAEAVSPQRAMTGTGISAGAAAGQTRRNERGFLSTSIILGSVVAGATAVIALQAATDDSTAPSTTQ